MEIVGSEVVEGSGIFFLSGWELTICCTVQVLF